MGITGDTPVADDSEKMHVVDSSCMGRVGDVPAMVLISGDMYDVNSTCIYVNINVGWKC